MDQQPVSFQELEKILQVIDSSPRNGSLTVKMNGMKISVTREEPGSSTKPQDYSAAKATAVEADPAESTQGKVAPKPSMQGSDSNLNPIEEQTSVGVKIENTYTVEAPLTGVFYRQPSPEADAFINEGERVKEGDVLAIIEVMKLMNRLTSPVSGVVRRICAGNENLVEQGDELFIIETTGEDNR